MRVNRKVPIARRTWKKPELSVTEHGWGYVIRSPHPMKTLPQGYEIGAWTLSISLMAIAWILLGRSLIWAIAPSLLILAVTHFSLRWFASVQTYEVVVDGKRREVRMGRVMPHGQVWFALGARFDEVSDIALHKGAEGEFSLWLWVRDEDEPVAFARGTEEAMLVIYDRMIIDIKSRNAVPGGPAPARKSGSGQGSGSGSGQGSGTGSGSGSGAETGDGGPKSRRPFTPLVPRELG